MRRGRRPRRLRQQRRPRSERPGHQPRRRRHPNDEIDQNCDGRDTVVGRGTPQVTLIWDNNNDMDLHVTEPGGRQIWYAGPGPTASGGLLDRDDSVGICGTTDPEPGGVENIYWGPNTFPSQGTYRVDVVEYWRCAESQASSWTVEVRFGVDLALRRTGSGSSSFSFTD